MLKKILVMLVALMLLILLISGCAPGVERISIATGGTGGVYFAYGGALASIITKHVPGLEATAEVTGASVENMRLIERGEAQLGTAMNDVIRNALHGEGVFEQAIELRTLFGMYPHFLHIVVPENSPITTIEELKGKKVSIGAPGSGTETKAKQVLALLGITEDQFNVFRLSFTENTEALRDGVIDAGIWSVGPPAASIMDLATTHRIRILDFTGEQMARIQEEHPYYNAMTLAAGTYQGVDAAVTAPSVWNSVVAHKDMPEEQAYAIVKAIFEQIEELALVYAEAAGYTTPDNAILNAVTPLHPGAVRYFREIGLDVPDNLIPPEMK